MKRFVIILIALASLLAGCSRKVCVPVERLEHVSDTLRIVKADTLRVIGHYTDSVEVRDSVFVMVKGDTVVVKEYHSRGRTKKAGGDVYKVHVDTVWRDRVNTRRVTEVKEVDKPLRWWQRVLMGAGVSALVAGIFSVAIWLKKKLR